jgi:hypothetical protein
LRDRLDLLETPWALPALGPLETGNGKLVSMSILITFDFHCLSLVACSLSRASYWKPETGNWKLVSMIILNAFTSGDPALRDRVIDQPKNNLIILLRGRRGGRRRGSDNHFQIG